MTKTKKILLSIISILAASFIGCVGLLVHILPDDLCATTVIAQYPSPNRKLKAVVFQIDCGATTSFNSQIAIVPVEIDPAQKDALPHSFFVADCNHNKAPSGPGGGPELRLYWKSDSALEVQYHELAGVIRDSSKSKGVSIEYHQFR
jgi:hypothetical protein